MRQACLKVAVLSMSHPSRHVPSSSDLLLMLDGKITSYCMVGECNIALLFVCGLVTNKINDLCPSVDIFRDIRSSVD